MRIHELNEGATGTLYHVMKIDKAESVFTHDCLMANWPHKINDREVIGISFSRNSRFWFGDSYVVKIAVDRAKITAQTKILPINADYLWSQAGKNDFRSDRGGKGRYDGGEMAEDFVLGKLAPLHLFIEHVEIRMASGNMRNVVRAAIEYCEKYSIPLKISQEVRKHIHDQERVASWDDEPYSDPIYFREEELAEGKNPNLRSAIRANGRVYQGDTHFDALDKIIDPKERQRATLDGNSRGFVNEKGRFLDRYRAADYARNFDLFDKSHPDWRYWMEDNPDLISEIPLRSLSEGYRLPLVPRARGSYGAFITTMHAEDFLRLTTLHEDHIKDIKDRAFPYTKEQYIERMDSEKGFGRFWMPFLNVAFPSGKVLGHEGRHRAAMVLAHGGDLVPVIIYPKTDEEYLAQARYYTKEGSKTIVSDDAYPTSEEAKANIEAKLSAMGVDEDNIMKIKVDFVGHSTLKGEPTRSEGWDRAKWVKSDFPDQLTGQFNPSIVVPQRNIKIGLVKGYRCFTR